ncbi:hypothetical protein [Novosphingobium sp. FKTRR1]|uniref:hypothetical protein n=1 Tax=Novosphingobium sp. FKTRR1 TaxID=2879118 RepID=UPI001CF08537|nr:hypothetical protein [Novosphingobium sp. FKTRR1]
MTETAGVLVVPKGAGKLHLPPRIRTASQTGTWPAAATLFAFYAAATLAFRFMLIGNPLVHVDEQFYLLVADRWAHGALPFVDIWDRKPVGLFVLYRLFLLVPIDPVLSYQLFGIASTAATALVIERLARKIAPPTAAWQAGLVYVFAMPGFSCAFGQAPVFYNLLMAMAVLVLVDIWKRPETTGLLARGCVVMALAGLAMQIKYCVLFEGIAFGLILMARAWVDGRSVALICRMAIVWVAVALLPTLLALCAFMAIGHGADFIQANFVSIFQRLPDGPEATLRLFNQTLALTPFWLAIFLAPRLMSLPVPQSLAARNVLRMWGLAAVVGYLVFGTWYDHYVAPMLPPLCVLAAPALARTIPGERWIGRLLLGAAALGGLIVMGIQLKNHGNATEAEALTGLIRQQVHSRSFYMYDGDPALYRMVGAPIPTRYAFPTHLNTWTEAPAIGTDPVREIARIMTGQPDVVMIGEWSDPYQPNHQSRAVVQAFLARDYERYAGFVLGTHRFGLYRLRSL